MGRDGFLLSDLECFCRTKNKNDFLLKLALPALLRAVRTGETVGSIPLGPPLHDRSAQSVWVSVVLEWASSFRLYSGLMVEPGIDSELLLRTPAV